MIMTKLVIIICLCGLFGGCKSCGRNSRRCTDKYRHLLLSMSLKEFVVVVIDVFLLLACLLLNDTVQISDLKRSIKLNIVMDY